MNTFGTSSQKFPLYDPRSVRESRIRFRRDDIPLLNRANSFYCPTGQYSSRGWILLARSDYNKLDKYSTSLRLEINDPTKPDNVGTLLNLAIVQAQCVTRGISADDDAIYLVEITDGRGILHNQWFQFPLTKWYNIRSPAYPQTFQSDSLNGGTTWTWSTMLQNIWEQMGTFLGAWPGLPVTPDGTPEGFWFPGVPAWTALNDILDHIGLTVACDLTKAAPFTIVQPGAADTMFTDLQTKYKTHLEDDLEWIDTGAARIPKTVKVLFRRRNSVYGSEETVYYGNDSTAKQWDMDSVYTVSVTAPAAFASAVGTHYLWSDFTVRYDMDGNPLAADTATATTVAQGDVTEYFAKIYHQTLGYMSQTYTGALPFTTGSRVDAVRWAMDHPIGSWWGWRTQIMRGQQPSGVSDSRG